jgi:predicted 3-demethylubiquinone-9 3-methyltransferase (glyoxalase superfamily)
MQKITPFLWFDSQAEEAVNFYTSVFKNSKAGKATRYDEAGAAATGRKAGSIMTIDFYLDGLEFTAINAGPVLKFNPSISFFVVSKDESEIDRLWKKFSDGVKVLMELDKYDWSKKYGWVEDKFELSWQLLLAEDEVKQKIVPSLLFVDKAFGKAEEAINFYTSIFKNSKLESVYKFPDNEKAVMYSDISLEGNLLAAMDGPGEHGLQFNEAISFVVN